MRVLENIDAQAKTTLVLESFSGRSIADICEEYGIETKQFWEWRKIFLLNAPKIFEADNMLDSNSNRQSGINSLRTTINEIVSEKLLELFSVNFELRMDRASHVLEPNPRFYRVLEGDFERSTVGF